MAHYEDKVLHDIDGIEEYDNPMPGWLMAIFWGSIVFAILYMGYYALAFGERTLESEYRSQAVAELAAVQAYFGAHPLVPPTTSQMLTGAVTPEVLAAGRDRFARTCSPCHGAAAQGLIGPNLTDGYWLHGGQVAQIFQTIAKGVPAKGMPPWGRAIPPAELSALVSYVRSLQGSGPAGARPPEGQPVTPEPLPERGW
ncbi:MAG: c-type cytochrome [Candidatus Latescibacterota bacterium]